MTRDQIKQRVGEELEDAGFIHFDNAAIDDSIDDGYQLLALTTGFYEKATTISLVANHSWYDFASLIPDFYYTFSIFNTFTRRWLVPENYAKLRWENTRWQSISGNPFNWTPMGAKDVLLYPTPLADAVNVLYVYYKAFPPRLAGSEEPLFQAELHEILVDYAVQDLLDINLEYTKSEVRFARFVEKQTMLKKLVNKRSLPDRVHSLTCSYLLTPTLIG